MDIVHVSKRFVICSYLLMLMMTRLSFRVSYKSFLEHQKSERRTLDIKELHTKLQGMYAQASAAAKTDPLTGAYNRRHFIKILDRKLRNIKGTNGRFFLAIFDLDLFKQINDDYGHVEGDKALATVTQAMKNNIRDDGVICRYGGDEFLLLLETLSWEVCKTRIETITHDIKILGKLNCLQGVNLATSVGVCRASGENPDLNSERLISRADEALRKVKHTRKGSILLA